ncbi:MAG: DNA repair protein RecO [Deltaproteobacteria bacterium]|nr:DNA repair protein RecO [Deltaproteobacteria bacterium]
MSHLYTTSAILLNSIDYGESDRIVNFYTIDFGKMGGIAKGAKRSKKRFVNCLEPFSYVKIIFAQKQNASLVRIDQCELIDGFHSIKHSLEAIASGSYFLELLSEMVKEGQKNTRVFELLLNFLKYLDAGREPETLTRFFEIKLLSILGYQPHLDRCVVCKKLVDTDVKIYFSSPKGGIICQSCITPLEPSIPISHGTAKSLALAANAGFEGLSRLTLSFHIKNESARMLEDFIRYQLGKELKSKRFIKEVFL